MNCLRTFRIAFSVGSGIACFLLIVLWVRSYYLADVLFVPLSDTRTMAFGSVQGGLSMSPYVPTVPIFLDSWKLQTETIGQRKTDYWVAQSSWTLRNLRFGVVRRSTHSTFCVPHCLLALTTGTLAVMLWANRFSRRFGLRTLLIATTLVAVLLGAIVYAIR